VGVGLSSTDVGDAAAVSVAPAHVSVASIAIPSSMDGVGVTSGAAGRVHPVNKTRTASRPNVAESIRVSVMSSLLAEIAETTRTLA
jgi:hypothetical protein